LKKSKIIFLAGIFLLFPAIAMGKGIPTTELAGLRVVGPGYGLNGTELQAFNQRSGLFLALIVHAPKNKKIVDVDDSKCSLTVLTDDLGHNLLDGVDWDSFPKVSKDGRLALIEVTSKSRPSKSASRIRAKGTIHLRIAGSERTEKIENLKLEVGIKTHIEENILQVMKVQKENDGLNLVLQSKRTFTETFKAVRFYTSKDHSINIWGRGSFTFGNASQMEYNLDLRSMPETLIMEIDLWQELEGLDIPFEIDSGLGL
jgi:hypothetical protein